MRIKDICKEKDYVEQCKMAVEPIRKLRRRIKKNKNNYITGEVLEYLRTNYDCFYLANRDLFYMELEEEV